MTALQWFAAILIALVLGSAIGIVYSKHVARSLFVELRKQQLMIDELNIDWGRLQLEQSTWATPGRVEQLAYQQLNMYVPDFNQRLMVVK